MMPHTVVLSLNRAAPAIPGWPAGQTGQQIRDYFDPSFPTALVDRAEGARSCAENPSCIGVYSDNELPLGRSVLQVGTYLDAYLTLPSGAPGKLALQAFFEDRYADDIGAMNAVWSLDLASFDEIQTLTEVEDDSEFCARDQRRADRQAFVAAAASAYFEAVHEALRTLSPDLLILGSRLMAVYTAPAIIEAAAPWVDVMSLNDYDFDENGRGLFKNDGVPHGYLFLDDPVTDLDTVHQLSGRPIMISEWSVRTPTPGVDILFPPFMPTAETQEERADRYERFMSELLARDYVVGSHWFKFHDQPATGRGDGENSLWGVVDIDDDPYPELTERMAAVGASIYDRPAASQPASPSLAETALPLGRRVFSPAPVEAERSGFFVFILPGTNLASEIAGGPLLLDAGVPNESGVAPLSLAEDVTLAYPTVTGDVACLRLAANGSHGELACDGGFGHDARIRSEAGNLLDPPLVEPFLGSDGLPGSATLFATLEFTQLSSGAIADDCWTTNTWRPAYETALSTATVTTLKGATSFDVTGEPFVCGLDGEDWRTEDGPGMFVVGMPLFDARVPDGDLSAAFRVADSQVGCR
jgi:hypothetical protein